MKPLSDVYKKKIVHQNYGCVVQFVKMGMSIK